MRNYFALFLLKIKKALFWNRKPTWIGLGFPKLGIVDYLRPVCCAKSLANLLNAALKISGSNPVKAAYTRIKTSVSLSFKQLPSLFLLPSARVAFSKRAQKLTQWNLKTWSLRTIKGAFNEALWISQRLLSQLSGWKP